MTSIILDRCVNIEQAKSLLSIIEISKKRLAFLVDSLQRKTHCTINNNDFMFSIFLTRTKNKIEIYPTYIPTRKISDIYFIISSDGKIERIVRKF